MFLPLLQPLASSTKDGIYSCCFDHRAENMFSSHLHDSHGSSVILRWQKMTSLDFPRNSVIWPNPLFLSWWAEEGKREWLGSYLREKFNLLFVMQVRSVTEQQATVQCDRKPKFVMLTSLSYDLWKSLNSSVNWPLSNSGKHCKVLIG